jgi:hypothetical protein
MTPEYHKADQSLVPYSTNSLKIFRQPDYLQKRPRQDNQVGDPSGIIKTILNYFGPSIDRLRLLFYPQPDLSKLTNRMLFTANNGGILYHKKRLVTGSGNFQISFNFPICDCSSILISFSKFCSQERFICTGSNGFLDDRIFFQFNQCFT